MPYHLRVCWSARVRGYIYNRILAVEIINILPPTYINRPQTLTAPARFFSVSDKTTIMMKLAAIITLITISTLTAASAIPAPPRPSPCIRTTICPDGFVIRDPCDLVYIQDPCWNHQKGDLA
ncbi:hypothetical protein EX30DRAFT_341831 [Ascodesmis nigricans]|uniref:Uncharacterized protein n=1 Tax=Ascodesmis nigricans TaxID=341454 RepID=A0A4S2MU10_9PEZI|nr:hypothetical protein EX30DRAFT_341831 [Ascodesmis nigricans]